MGFPRFNCAPPVIRVRVAWGQRHKMRLIISLRNAAFSICLCCLSACHRKARGGRVCQEENKHISWCLSSKVRPNACWGVRLCQMAARTCMQHTIANTKTSWSWPRLCSPPVDGNGNTWRGSWASIRLGLSEIISHSESGLIFLTSVIVTVEHCVCDVITALTGTKAVGPSWHVL